MQPKGKNYSTTKATWQPSKSEWLAGKLSVIRPKLNIFYVVSIEFGRETLGMWCV